jgi:hypothetical protein
MVTPAVPSPEPARRLAVVGRTGHRFATVPGRMAQPDEQVGADHGAPEDDEQDDPRCRHDVTLDIMLGITHAAG